MTTENTQPLEQGIATANAQANGQDTQAYAQECADVKRWQKAISDAREFDKVARKRYARDRSYARADKTHFEVDVPIAQSYVDVMRSFLYAQDPDVDVTPSPLTEPPPHKAILAMAAKGMQPGQQLPSAIASLLGTQGGQGASPALPGGPAPAELAQAGAQGAGGADAAGEDQLRQMVSTLLEPYQRMRENAEQFAATLEIIVPALWRKAKLKAQAKELVGSSLTIGPGWLKAVWLQRMGRDPEIEAQINDIQDNLARMAQLRKEIADGSASDIDASEAELKRQAEGLEAKVEIVVARGFAIDFVAGEDIQVSMDCRDLASYTEASWMAHRSFHRVEDAKAEHPDIADKMNRAITYYPVKPRDTDKARDSGSMDTGATAADADAFTTSTGNTSEASTMSGEAFLCKWEVWDRTTSTVVQFFEGMDCYAKPPFPPYPATTRFYPFFGYFIGHVNGERHPRSLITRSERLFDEYNAIRSNYRKHRRRAIPKCGFDATNYDDQQIAKLEGATTGELVGLKPVRPGEPIDKSIVPIQYNQVDMALYDTGVIRAELEMIWGIQEALSSSIHTAKTATEAEIQQHGTESRTGYMRDDLDEMLSDLATYTAEVALQVLDENDVTEIAGPWALWPTGMTVEDLQSLVKVSIHAGSTGKPNTAARRQAWAAILPPLQNAIEQVAKLRGSSPDDVADCIEAMIEETIATTGERIDANKFLPDPPRTPPAPVPPPQPPIAETALNGLQIQALTQVLADVRGGVITGDSAIALIHASAPQIPEDIVTRMVNGSLPQPGDAPTQLKAPHATTANPPPAAAPAMPTEGAPA
ncbi:hypothetical protein ACO2Q2_13295 [Dyella sp. KRB-257]|uniref:hypothetical protein n=1 Tax=Dyella sp. KRB-257 TaxID=3400915 RepID=UPI003C06781D